MMEWHFIVRKLLAKSISHTSHGAFDPFRTVPQKLLFHRLLQVVAQELSRWKAGDWRLLLLGPRARAQIRRVATRRTRLASCSCWHWLKDDVSSPEHNLAASNVFSEKINPRSRCRAHASLRTPQRSAELTGKKPILWNPTPLLARRALCNLHFARHCFLQFRGGSIIGASSFVLITSEVMEGGAHEQRILMWLWLKFSWFASRRLLAELSVHHLAMSSYFFFQGSVVWKRKRFVQSHFLF